MEPYPRWAYYPTRDKPPAWATALVGVVTAAQQQIESSNVRGLTSDKVLALLRPGLEGIGYRVETGKTTADRITLPVLFGEQGLPRVRYDVDGVHDELGVLLEVEAGRGARGNAVYRDLVRTSLIVDARFLALGVMQEYHHKNAGKNIVVHSYNDAKDQLDAVFASQRLRLPFEGVLLFGY
ncbi:MAG: hypothetical protein QOE69_1638 [Thermoleophilaceae bacterium]|jgi:hypothetical protein|nr:hypothetical protein [Thermoleophilaceae bacterium]